MEEREFGFSLEEPTSDVVKKLNQTRGSLGC